MERDIALLSTTPWCAALLSDPRNEILHPESRRAGVPGPGWHTFLSRTLNTPDTIAAFVALHARDEGATTIAELKALVRLGGDGLNGHPGVCHGGVVSTVLDEVMGLAVVANTRRGAVPGPDYMTAQLNVSFLGPVAAGRDYLARCRVKNLEGRKLWMEETFEDGEGRVLARAEGLFVRLKPKV